MGLLEQLERRRPGYDVEMEHVRFLLDSYTGGGGYQGQVRQPTAGWWGRGATQYSQLAAFEEAAGAPSYLDRYPREDWAKYDARRAQAHLWNFVEPLTNLKLGHLAERRPSYLGQPQALAEWRENVDGVGTTWDEMRPSVALAAAIFGWAPVVIDSTPALEGESVAQARLRGATRPRAIPLTPANLVDYEAEGMRFRWAKVRTDHADRDEWSGEIVHRSEYRVWTPERVSIFEVRERDRQRDAFVVAEDQPHPFGQVPIAVFRHKPAPGDLIRGMPMHEGIALAQRRLFNLLSELDEHMRSQVSPTLVLAVKDTAAVSELVIGTNSAIPLDGDARQSHYYLSPGTGCADSYEKRIEVTIRDGIYRAALAEFKRPTITKGGSLEFDASNRLLGEFAAQMARAERWMDSIAWVGLGGDREELRGYRITPPVDFGVTELKDEIANTITALAFDLGPTMRGRLTLRLADRLEPNMPAAVRAQVQAEIEGGVTVTSGSTGRGTSAACRFGVALGLPKQFFGSGRRPSRPDRGHCGNSCPGPGGQSSPRAKSRLRAQRRTCRPATRFGKEENLSSGVVDDATVMHPTKVTTIEGEDRSSGEVAQRPAIDVEDVVTHEVGEGASSAIVEHSRSVSGPAVAREAARLSEWRMTIGHRAGLALSSTPTTPPPPSKSAVTKAADDEGSDPEKMSLGELLRRLKLGSAVRLAVGLGAAFVVVAGAGWRVGYWQRGVEREAGEAEAQRTTRAPEANAPSARRGAIDTISDGSEPSEEVEEVRTANGVSLIESAEAELPVDELPAGRYGFCIPWIGLQEGLRCTVRAQRLGSDVEIHKLPSGEVRVLLFASPERALELRQGRAARGVFYPSARPEAPDLVQIPSRLIRSIRSRRWGLLTDPDAVNMFDVEVEAAHGRGG